MPKVSTKKTRTQELTEELEDAEYTLQTQKRTMSVNKQNELMNLISNLTTALKEEKLKNYDKDCKDAAQLKIMQELKRRNEEKDRKITILERNSAAINTKEIQEKIKIANENVITDKLIKSTKRKYDSYIEEWLDNNVTPETKKKH